MRTLDDLRKYISALPCRFASDDGATADIITPDTGSVTNFKAGFPVAYGGSESSAEIARKEFNAVGAIATDELCFRESGGVHYFDQKLAGFYPNGAVIPFYDGSYLYSVESCKSRNAYEPTLDTISVTDNDGKFYWRYVDYRHGASSDLMRFGADFTDRRDLTNGGTVDCDCLVTIGATFYPIGASEYGKDNPDFADGTSFLNVVGSVTLLKGDKSTRVGITCKGKCGVNVELQDVIPFPMFGNSGFAPRPICGMGTYFSHLFVRNGTTVSWDIDVAVADKSTTSHEIEAEFASYYPLRRFIGKADD